MAKGFVDTWEAIKQGIRDRIGFTYDIDDRMIREVLTRIEKNDRVSVSHLQGGESIIEVADLKNDRDLDWVQVHVPTNVATALIPPEPSEPGFISWEPNPALNRPRIDHEGW